MEIIQEKESRAGLIGTIVFHAILLLCIIFFGMSYQDPAPINESAMLIDFGNAGGGSSSASQESEAESTNDNESSTNDLSATENVTASAPENVQTQTTAETIEVNAASSNSAAETTEPEQVVSDNLSNVMDALNNASSSQENSSQNNGSNSGDGSSTGDGTGVGPGTGPGEGVGWDLVGRGKVSLTTPKNPTQEDGTVVVEIVVDNKGNVIKATPGARGSSTTNATLYKVAKEAALKAKFTIKAGANDQKGKMTFIFILN